MSAREERVKIFEDTMDWINTDKDLSDSVNNAKNHTEIFYEDDYPEFNQKNICDTQITVTRHRSFEAAIKLHKTDITSKIAVLNFANAFHAGGGVTTGSSAQEESLCRTSTLYPLIYRKYLRDTFYKHHFERNNPKATDSLIYTEGVIICKTDEDLPQRMKKED